MICPKTINIVKTDLAGPIENGVKNADEDYNCNAYLCRGYQYEDNEASLHTFSAGEVVDFHVDLIAGHRPGYAVRGGPAIPSLIKYPMKLTVLECVGD